MGASNYSMSLQDIYKWFIENTDKGLSSASGWRNSIRHNLSMNAAFRKSGQLPASSSGQAPKKSSEWVLEPWAVKDGVVSTTSYRKIKSKKTPTSRDPSTIKLSLQSAGKKGGCKAGRMKALRRSRLAESPRPRGDRERDMYCDQNRQRNFDALKANSHPIEDVITPTAGLAGGPYYGHCAQYYYEEPQYHFSQFSGCLS